MSGETEPAGVRLNGFRWAAVPEALIYAGHKHGRTDYAAHQEVSDAAFRVYAAVLRHGTDPENCYPSKERLAALLGKDERTIQRLMRELEAAGWVERVARHGVDGRQLSNGVQVNESPARGRESNLSRGGESVQGEGDTDVSQTRAPGNESPKTSPTPPQAEGGPGPELGAPEQPGLFGPGGGGATTRAEKKARAGGAIDIRVKGAYASWAETRYPKGNRGSRPAGERALAKAFRAGASMAEIDEQTANYAAARRAYHDAWAHVGNYWPSLMNASTFLNGKRELFEREWTRDDLRYWPAPAGWSWDDLAVMSHDAVVDDVPADVRAEGGLAVAMWRAKNRDAGAVAGG